MGEEEGEEEDHGAGARGAGSGREKEAEEEEEEEEDEAALPEEWDGIDLSGSKLHDVVWKRVILDEAHKVLCALAKSRFWPAAVSTRI